MPHPPQLCGSELTVVHTPLQQTADEAQQT
jgi:hypothetical protein